MPKRPWTETALSLNAIILAAATISLNSHIAAPALGEPIVSGVDIWARATCPETGLVRAIKGAPLRFASNPTRLCLNFSNDDSVYSMHDVAVTYGNYYTEGALQTEIGALPLAGYPVFAYATMHHTNGIWYLAVAQGMLELQDLDGVAAQRAPGVLHALIPYGFQVFSA